MSGQHSDDAAWFDQETGSETVAESAALGGALSESGRHAAIGATLPLLGLYFASGEQPLSIRSSVGTTQAPDPSLSSLLAGIRLRVALAAAGHLHSLLARIVSRPTFRYTLTSGESTGDLTGTLDINRYSTRGGALTEVPSYPILEVRRGEQTPENVLATYSAMWIVQELTSAAADSVVAPDSPEHVAYRAQTRALNESLRLPELASCLPATSEISGRSGERRLIDDVRRRLRRREISNASPYLDLVAWVQRCLDGSPAAEPGELDWSFYGDRFDTKLFELWCLRLLAVEVSRQLAVDLPPVNQDWRRGKPAFVWDRPAGILEMNFQRSVPRVSEEHPARWVQVDDETRALGGIPDIVVKATRRADGAVRVAILDPKLRQRGGRPIEELYKVIGYLDNYGLGEAPSGAILYHTTSHDDLPRYAYQPRGGGGMLHAVALNPADLVRSRTAIAPVASMLLGLLDIPRLDNTASSDSDSSNPQATAEANAQARLAELQALGQTLPESILDASRRRVQALIGDARWVRIPSNVRTMLATSEHVGFSLEPGADFSGPVIGIAASVESALHDLLITPAVAHNLQLAADCKTLGQAIYAVQKAVDDRPDPLYKALRTFMSRRNIDRPVVRRLLNDLGIMNRVYRIPAAHRNLVSDANWRSAWTLIIGQGDLLSRTIDALDSSGSIWQVTAD